MATALPTWTGLPAKEVLDLLVAALQMWRWLAVGPRASISTKLNRTLPRTRSVPPFCIEDYQHTRPQAKVHATPGPAVVPAFCDPGSPKTVPARGRRPLLSSGAPRRRRCEHGKGGMTDISRVTRHLVPARQKAKPWVIPQLRRRRAGVGATAGNVAAHVATVCGPGGRRLRGIAVHPNRPPRRAPGRQ